MRSRRSDPAAGLAPGRAAPRGRRRAGQRRCSTSAWWCSTTRASSSARDRPVLLPPEARVAPRGAALGACVPARRGGARPAARLDQVHGADRDDPRRLRDGRDPVRVARPLVRAQRRPLGLHLQLHQEDRSGLPDRAQVTMTVPFMRAYTSCSSGRVTRGARTRSAAWRVHPSRRDPEVNAVALAKVEEDKRREAGDGFDGTWVAHPDLVAVALAEFDAVLGERPNQVERQRADVVGAWTTCSTSRCPAVRSPTKVCASTSASASVTSTRGCRAPVPQRSTT